MLYIYFQLNICSSNLICIIKKLHLSFIIYVCTNFFWTFFYILHFLLHFADTAFFFFFFFWLHWVFIAAHGLSLVAASGGYSSLRCAGFSLWWLLLLQSTGSRCTQASVVAAHELSSCGMWALERAGFIICGAWAQ